LIIRCMAGFLFVISEGAQAEQYFRTKDVTHLLIMLVLLIFILVLFLVIMPFVRKYATNSIEINEAGLVVNSGGRMERFAWKDVMHLRKRVDTDGGRGGVRLVVEVVPKDVLSKITTPQNRDLPYVDLPVDQLIKMIEDSRPAVSSSPI
jgi:hypothetical protein